MTGWYWCRGVLLGHVALRSIVTDPCVLTGHGIFLHGVFPWPLARWMLTSRNMTCCHKQAFECMRACVGACLCVGRWLRKQKDLLWLLTPIRKSLSECSVQSLSPVWLWGSDIGDHISSCLDSSLHCSRNCFYRQHAQKWSAKQLSSFLFLPFRQTHFHRQVQRLTFVCALMCTCLFPSKCNYREIIADEVPSRNDKYTRWTQGLKLNTENCVYSLKSFVNLKMFAFFSCMQASIYFWFHSGFFYLALIIFKIECFVRWIEMITFFLRVKTWSSSIHCAASFWLGNTANSMRLCILQCSVVPFSSFSVAFIFQFDACRCCLYSWTEFKLTFAQGAAVIPGYVPIATCFRFNQKCEQTSKCFYFSQNTHFRIKRGSLQQHNNGAVRKISEIFEGRHSVK